jgi:hypothetical protein
VASGGIFARQGRQVDAREDIGPGDSTRIQLVPKYGLDEAEIDFISTRVKEMA